MPARKSRLIRLPGAGNVRLDPATIVCVRTETGETGSLVVVHTSEGFAVGVAPAEDQTVSDLADEIAALV